MKTYQFLALILMPLGTLLLPAKSIHDLKLEAPLPTFITAVTTFGQRPDWSPDGKSIVFLEKTYGDVYQVDIATREVVPLTHDYYHEGYTRALYLPNGDILLSGARSFDAQNPGASRNEANAELWVFRPGAGKPPVPLGVNCREGPAVSRTQMRINWAVGEELHLADIAYDNKEQPYLANHRVVLTHADLPYENGHIEAQDFRPGAEHELLINIYRKIDNTLSETYGLDLRDGSLTDYSLLPDRYSEPEGVFPSGQHILLESSRHAHNFRGQKNYTGIDLYILALDGSGATTRLTTFNENPTFKASQGVISPDGRYMAFQISRTTDLTGFGYGIMLMDIPAYMSAQGLQMPGTP